MIYPHYSQFPLLHIDLNQQILDHHEALEESPKPIQFSLSSYSGSSLSPTCTLSCPISINLNEYCGENSDQKEPEEQNKEENTKFSISAPFDLYNFSETKKLADINGIKVEINELQESGKNKSDSADDYAEGFSMNWTSTKIRFTRKVVKSCEDDVTSLHDDHPGSSEKDRGMTPYPLCDTTTRICADCSTTRTPLWRSGPRGPKSLCNACGIRQRKARRAMASITAAVDDNSPPLKEKIKRRIKQPKDANHISMKRRKFPSISRRKKKTDMEDGFFPQDEKDAAILLMALSYGMF